MDGGIELRRTDDYESLVRLAKESGLEISELGPVLSAFGLYAGNRLVGCACLKEHAGSFLLECLAVDNQLRGRGLGTRLVREVESDARSRGAKRLLALARSPGFFRKAGYRLAGRGEVEYPTTVSCTSCAQFEVSCFPAVVLRDL